MIKALNLEDFPIEVRQLTSHGAQSSLIEHTWQVAQSAQENWEVVAAICHDIGKSHIKWQNYAKTFIQGESPFKHAVAGGVISYFLLKAIGESEENALASLHCVSAHHSELSNLDLPDITQEIVEICSSKECLHFASQLLCNWADIKEEHVKESFKNAIDIIEVISSNEEQLKEIDISVRLPSSNKARSLLGRLCLMDHRSAAYQSKQHAFKTNFPGDNTFVPRAKNKLFTSQYKIDGLRGKLKEQSLKLPKDKKFYILSAPTGLGKTNAALCLAEEIVKETKKERIIYTSALVSIGDQTFGDYLGEEGDNAQIWNYKRKELASWAKRRESIKDSLNEEIEELSLESPFSKSYNVTTFNQVLYALLHPNRNYAITSISLRNAVLIFDEYHALPTETLQALLEVLETRDDLQSIFLSATPSHTNLWEKRKDDLVELEDEFIEEMNSSDTTKSRRIYIKEKPKNASDIAALINSHKPSEGDLLVMVNLIGKGTVPIAKLCGLKADPWNRGGTNEQGSKIYWLDGTLPPSLRYKTIQEIKENRGKGIILLCTQIIQAGVDLEFDTGYGDFFSFISAIQTAGRVGRNTGNKNKFYCFSFQLEDEKGGGSTRDVLTKHGLNSLKGKYPSAWEDNLSRIISKRLEKKFFLEKEAFEKWDGTLEEETLKNLNTIIEEKLPKLPDKILPLALSPCPPYLGLNLSSLSTLTELYGDEHFNEKILIPEDYNVNEVLLKCTHDPKYRRKLKQELTIREPKELEEMLQNEGFVDTGIKISEIPIWQRIKNQI